MKALVLWHVATEGPGTLGSFLESTGVTLEHCRLFDGAAVPDSTRGLDAVISMGGPMNVYEEEAYPFLRDETAFLAEAIRRDVPIIGICLGAQMIAKAAGARVVASPQKEVGWSSVTLTDSGRSDPFFTGLPEPLEVLQWHGDMFEIPEGGSLLASSAACPHQALRIRNALGLQFHVEVTDAMLRDWFAGSPDLDAILDRYETIAAGLRRVSERIVGNFLERMESRR